MQSTNSSKDRFERALKAIEVSSNMQRDWELYGIDFIDSYVDNIDGDWLEKWGQETNSEAESAALSELELNQISQLNAKIRSILDEGRIDVLKNVDINTVVERIIEEFLAIVESKKPSERLFNASRALRRICLGDSDLELAATTRSSSGSASGDWLEVAEEILDELEEVWEEDSD